MNVLFVCSRNQWRSPTAERVWQNIQGVSVRSAGTSPRAKRSVSGVDIQWADVIFVMESKHQQRLQAEFRQLLSHKNVQVLNIPDEYKYMSPELVEIFEELAASFLNPEEIGNSE